MGENENVKKNSEFMEQFKKFIGNKICWNTNKKLNYVINEVHQLKKDREEHRETIEIVLRANYDIKMYVNELEQYWRKNNIIINGIPYERDENLHLRK